MVSDEYLLKKYKNHIKPGETGAEKLIELLKEKFDLVETNKATISKFFWQFMVLDCLPDVEESECDFYICQIKKNKKSKFLYKSLYKMQDIGKKEKIFIVFEKNNNFITSNSPIMNDKLFLDGGVSKYDYDNNTINLISYLVTYKYFYEFDYFKLFK